MNLGVHSPMGERQRTRTQTRRECDFTWPHPAPGRRLTGDPEAPPDGVHFFQRDKVASQGSTQEVRKGRGFEKREEIWTSYLRAGHGPQGEVEPDARQDWETSRGLRPRTQKEPGLPSYGFLQLCPGLRHGESKADVRVPQGRGSQRWCHVGSSQESFFLNTDT